MIRLLDGQGPDLADCLPAQGANALRLRALWKAYGTGYDFVRFYADGGLNIAVGVQDAFAALWLRHPDDRAALAEAAEFLPLAARSFVSEVPLPLEGLPLTRGRSFLGRSLPGLRQEGVSNRLQDSYEVLSRVFPGVINGGTYRQWYADLSHRVRHGMSKAYTLAGVCTGIRYCVEEGLLCVVQLATLPEYRGRGLARRLLSHILADSLPRRGILVQSQDAESDRFYEHMGFEAAGQWFCYEQDGPACGRSEKTTEKGIGESL